MNPTKTRRRAGFVFTNRAKHDKVKILCFGCKARPAVGKAAREPNTTRHGKPAADGKDVVYNGTERKDP